MAGHCCKWLDIAANEEKNVWKIEGYGQTLLDIKCRDVHVNDGKLLKITGNGCKCLEMSEMNLNDWKWLNIAGKGLKKRL